MRHILLRVLVLAAVGIAGSLPVNADTEKTGHCPVYAIGIRPKSAVLPVSPSQTEQKSTATPANSGATSLSSTGEYISRTGQGYVRESPPRRIRGDYSRYQLQREYEADQKAGKAVGWFDQFVNWVGGIDTQNAGSLLEAGRNTDNLAGAEAFKNTPLGIWANRVGTSAEAADFTIKAAKTYTEYQKDERRAIKQGNFTAVKEMTKFFLGNIVGGRVVAATLIVPAAAISSVPLTAFVVVGIVAWGATTITENAVERIGNYYFHPVRYTARTGTLSDDIVNWLGTRTKEGFTLDTRLSG